MTGLHQSRRVHSNEDCVRLLKVQPRRVLVQRPRCRVSNFLDELGRLMYPEEWSAAQGYDFNSEAKNRSDQIAYTPAQFVFWQMVEACQIGMAKTEVLLTCKHLSDIFASNEDDGTGFFASNEDDGTGFFASNEDDGTGFATGPNWLELPSPGYYPIKPSFCEDNDWAENVDWASSLAKVRIAHIRLPGSEPDFDDIAESSEFLRFLPHAPLCFIPNVPLYIVDPDKVLANALAIPPLPTPELVHRYRTTQRHLWSELTAVAWRFLALEKLQDHRGLNARLVKELQSYMQVHDLYEHGDSRAPSEAMLKHVLRQILDQWRAGETELPVLVSPSPARGPKND